MKTLIILHGWQSSKERWQKVKELVGEEGIEVIIPDMPGFKPQTDLKRGWSLQDYVNWLEKLIETRSLSVGGGSSPKFFLLGHSFGGRVALKFAEKFPEAIQGLILVASAGIKKKRPLISKTVSVLKKFSFLPGYGFLRNIFYRYILRKTDYLEASPVMKETMKNVLKEDLTPVLSKIPVSTLIIWGREDKITPLKDALSMKEKIPNSKLEILEDIGHAPHLEDPELLSQKIKEFTR